MIKEALIRKLEGEIEFAKADLRTFLSNPISFKALLSNDVNIVTPTILILPDTFFAALRASKPELMCIVK